MDKKQLKSEFFQPANEIPNSKREVFSPSGQYKLIISNFSTRPGSWNYSQGKVFSKNEDKPIAIIQRNYSSFPFSWVENHQNGHDYLICGEDYQGQTVIELDTGKRRSLMSDGSEKGFGFCWAKHRFDQASTILVVDGCFWGSPYEFKFFDFSDPMNGWPELITDNDTYNYGDEKWPTFEEGGFIKVYQSEAPNDDDDDDVVEPKKDRPLISYMVFARVAEENELVLIEEWVSDKEKESRLKREEASQKHDEWRQTFKSQDPLYLRYLELLECPELLSDAYESIGTTYERWAPDFNGNEKRWCSRIHDRHLSKNDNGITLDLEWAVETGPIKLIIFKGGKHIEDEYFEHSVEGMEKAFERAKGLVKFSSSIKLRVRN